MSGRRRWSRFAGSTTSGRPTGGGPTTTSTWTVSICVSWSTYASEDVSPRGQSRLVLSETCRGGADQPEGQVIAEIDVDQLGQRPHGFGQVGCLLRGQVHVLGGARPRHPSEHAHPALEEPFGLLARSEDAQKESIEASLTDLCVDGCRADTRASLAGCLLRGVLDRQLKGPPVGIAVRLSHDPILPERHRPARTDRWPQTCHRPGQG